MGDFMEEQYAKDDERKHHEHKWKNGILDTIFDGLEEEIKRVNKKLGLE